MFRLIESGNLSYYQIDSFFKTGLVDHCFTTRCGGVSIDEYESLNLRMNCDDKRENILKNYEIICNEINIDYKKLVFSNQVHEDKIHIVDKTDCGNGIIFDNKFKSADALITAEENVPLITFYADCVPVFFLDTKKRVIALAHSGWKGTVKNIASKTVKKMREQFACCDILAAIGPSIGECCFEVGDYVADIFSELDGGVVKKYDKRYHVNLQKTVENQLIAAGIKQEKITIANICTCCHSDLLFSHRKTNGKRGSLAAIMQLR